MASDEPYEDRTRSYSALTSGTTVGHYQIVSKIGSGGMGEVYLALDTKLNRKVALKFLPSHLCQDDDCRKRFTREAQAAAGLDHPNIAGIHEVGEYQGRPFYSMQVVQGQSLQQVIAGKDLPIERILEIAIQICEGLQAAHAKGVIHRDIKPSNILLDEQGRVRIVDFGLASVRGSEQLTKTGSTLGTVGYMSPEQVLGKEVDQRSDIFSLGVVLHEMITKQNPFKRDAEAATIRAVVDDFPEPLARFKSGVPDGLQSTIDKALEKNPATRYQHADDLKADLMRIKGSSETMFITGPSERRRLAWVPWVAATLILVTAIAYLLVSKNSRDTRAVPPAIHRQITYWGDVQRCEISKDGEFYAFTRLFDSRHHLYVADLHGGSPVELISSDHIPDFRWSPDGVLLAVNCHWSDSALGTYLVPRLGGESRQVLQKSCQDYRLAWSPDGGLLVSHNNCTATDSLLFYDVATDSSYNLTLEIGGEWTANLDWSPNGRMLLLTSNGSTTNALWTVDAGGGEAVVVLAGDFPTARWSAGGNAIYYLQDNIAGSRSLMRAEIDDGIGKLLGEPMTIAADLPASCFSITGDNRYLTYGRETHTSNLFRETALSGEVSNLVQLTSGTAVVDAPAVSPDGKTVLYSLRRDGRTDIYRVPMDGGTAKRLTFDGLRNESPTWSPDGESMAYLHSANGNIYHVRTVNLRTSGARTYDSAETVYLSLGLHWGTNQEIFYQKPGNRDIMMLDTASGVVREVLDDESNGWVFFPVTHPDGRKVAVDWNRKSNQEDGIWELSLTGDTQPRQLVQGVAGGTDPLRWSSDGNYLYYVDFNRETTALCRVNGQSMAVDTLMSLPHGVNEMLEALPTLAPDLRTLVYIKERVTSDVWLMEHFDPEEETK